MGDKFETKHGGEQVTLAGGMVRDSSANKLDYTLVRRGPMYQRWVELLDRGAKHYGPNNWCQALVSTDVKARTETKERFRASALRHFEQWLAGDRSEDHAAAVYFNLNGYEAMIATDPLEVKHFSTRTEVTLAQINEAHREGGTKLADLQRQLERDVDAKVGPSGLTGKIRDEGMRL